ncbi:MAG TPA: hypothetical protein VFE05_03335 [Longimicrobiaceae bacterium]|jgi:hypothetical protein|nr:hypothetical protein [Longimicrobiaceae bacterium]
MPDSFPAADVRILVMRFASGKPDVVMLNHATVDADALAAGMALLRNMRREDPRPATDVVAVVQGFAPGQPGAHAAPGWATRLAELQAQPRSRIGNLGAGRWIEMPDAVP